MTETELKVIAARDHRTQEYSKEWIQTPAAIGNPAADGKSASRRGAIDNTYVIR